MLKRIEGWDTMEAYRAGEFQGIEPGWYPCTILDARETTTPWNTDAVSFYFDIIDGKFVRYFDKDFNAQTGPDKEWRGVLQQATDEKGAPFFKGLITAIQESNPGYVFDFDETKLKGKKVGIGFRREWYEKDGQDKSIVKPFAFTDIKKVISGELEVPKDKQKKAKAVPAQGYTSPNLTPPGYKTPGSASAPSAYAATASTAPKYEALDDDEELPF